MDKFCLVALLIGIGCSTGLSVVVLDIYGSSAAKVLPEGHQLNLTCHFNVGFSGALDYTIYWIHRSMSSRDPIEETLSSQKVLMDKAKHGDNYLVDFSFTTDQTNFTLVLKNAQPWMDGKYICRAKPVDSSGKTLEKEAVVLIPADVQYVEMDFDGELIRSESQVTIERVEGNYGITCSTGGSNPAALLQLYLGDKPIPAPLSGADGRDVKAEDETDARRFQRVLSATNVPFEPEDDQKTLKCVARADFDGAKELVASVPLNIIALEPEIKCDTNASGSPGDRYVKLTCRVNHARVDVDHYSFEIEKTDEVIKIDSNSPNYHEVLVQSVEGMERTDDVSLVLYVAEDIHFDSHYYLDVFLKNGQSFRHRIGLQERDSPGAATKPVVGVLCLLLSALLWSL